ncbi:MAG: sigma-70 family RNA polymerase sigma factor [Symploca sp. SIO2E6]|nr:sigma-70 family RNA polymerase sigma factor [Symploca sp. SIO2E6]
MQLLIESNEHTTEEFWARSFLKVLRGELDAEFYGGQDYAKRHLSAYCQVICYEVALTISQKFSYVTSLKQLYTYEDYFQIANLSASDPGKLFQKFIIDLPYTVKAYASKRLEGIVIELIRQDNKHINWLKYSSWGLLRNVRERELITALNGSINPKIVDQYILVWRCFNEIYVPSKSLGIRHLASPNNEEWQQIAQLYNQRRGESSQSGKLIKEEEVKQMLTACTLAVRYRRKVSFSYPDSSEYLRWEEISDTSSLPLARLEKQEACNQINAILSEAFAQLSNFEQKHIVLQFGIKATQTEVAMLLNLKQFQVSRQWRHCKQRLLKAFVERCQERLNLALSNETIAQLDAPIKEWLKLHCQQFLSSLLEADFIYIHSEDKKIYQLHYCQGLSKDQIAQQLGLPIAEVTHRLRVIQQDLVTKFTNNIVSGSIGMIYFW